MVGVPVLFCELYDEILPTSAFPLVVVPYFGDLEVLGIPADRAADAACLCEICIDSEESLN